MFWCLVFGRGWRIGRLLEVGDSFICRPRVLHRLPTRFGRVPEKQGQHPGNEMRKKTMTTTTRTTKTSRQSPALPQKKQKQRTSQLSHQPIFKTPSSPSSHISPDDAKCTKPIHFCMHLCLSLLFLHPNPAFFASPLLASPVLVYSNSPSLVRSPCYNSLPTLPLSL